METEFRLSQIPSGLDGTDATIREIIRLVDYDLKRPHLRLLATRILNHATIPSKNHTREAQALYRYVVRNVRYQKDPVGLETVQSPTVTLSVGAGDCDDHSGLIAGLGMAVGLPARLTVVGYSEDRIVHIFAELFAGGSWHAVDTTEPGHGFGWRPEGLPYQRTYNLNGEVMDMAQALQRHRISKSDFRRLLRGKVRQHLMEYWQGGVINLAEAANSDLAFTTQLVVATLSQFNLVASESGRGVDIVAGFNVGRRCNLRSLADHIVTQSLTH